MSGQQSLKVFEYFGTEGARFMRISLVQISLLRFCKTFHKYLPYANFGVFISLLQFFGQKIAQNSYKANLSIEINSQKIALAKYFAQKVTLMK